MIRPIRLIPVFLLPHDERRRPQDGESDRDPDHRRNTAPRFGNDWPFPEDHHRRDRAGPSSGNSSGMATSSFCFRPRFFFRGRARGVGFARSISRPTPNRRMPPAILKAGSEIEKKLMMSEPAAPNRRSTTRHVIDACSAIRRRSASGRSAVIATKMGSAANVHDREDRAERDEQVGEQI